MSPEAATAGAEPAAGRKGESFGRAVWADAVAAVTNPTRKSEERKTARNMRIETLAGRWGCVKYSGGGEIGERGAKFPLCLGGELRTIS